MHLYVLHLAFGWPAVCRQPVAHRALVYLFGVTKHIPRALPVAAAARFAKCDTTGGHQKAKARSTVPSARKVDTRQQSVSQAVC